jgi:hypothetical protein
MLTHVCVRVRMYTVTANVNTATYTSPRLSSWTPGVFYTYFYNHARRLRLEKLELNY